MSSFEIVPYSKNLHGAARKAFSCGTPALDNYFHVQMSQDIKANFTTCFVATDDQGVIIGYYTLSSSGFFSKELSDETKIALKLRHYDEIPAARMGRLAVDTRFAGQGYGGELLADALARVARSEVAAYALIVDAKSIQAKAFYEHHGFISFPTNVMRLFLPLGGLPTS